MEEHDEDELDLIIAEKAYAEWVADGKKTYSLDEVRKELGLELKDLGLE